MKSRTVNGSGKPDPYKEIHVRIIGAVRRSSKRVALAPCAAPPRSVIRGERRGKHTNHHPKPATVVMTTRTEAEAENSAGAARTEAPRPAPQGFPFIRTEFYFFAGNVVQTPFPHIPAHFQRTVG